MTAAELAEIHLGQLIVDGMSQVLKSENGRRHFQHALIKQWPADRGEADLEAINATIDELIEEDALDIIVAAVPRIEFIRLAQPLSGGSHQSHLTRNPDGKTTLLMMEGLRSEEIIHETIDAIVGEIAVFAVVHDVQLDHKRLCRMAEAIAISHANLRDRSFLAP